MIPFRNWLKLRLDEKDNGSWEAERQKFLDTYKDNEKKALEMVEILWGSLSNFIHEDGEEKWAKLWSAIRSRNS